MANTNEHISSSIACTGNSTCDGMCEIACWSSWIHVPRSLLLRELGFMPTKEDRRLSELSALQEYHHAMERGLAVQTKKPNGSNWRSILTNTLFACVVVIGQVTQNVCLPLWLDSTKNTTDCTNGQSARVDSYFVLTFASFSFVVIFGCALLVLRTFGYVERRSVSFGSAYHVQLAKVGALCGTAASCVVFSSSGQRTAPYLQAILGSFSIPVTVLLRYLSTKTLAVITKFYLRRVAY